MRSSIFGTWVDAKSLACSVEIFASSPRGTECRGLCGDVCHNTDGEPGEESRESRSRRLPKARSAEGYVAMSAATRTGILVRSCARALLASSPRGAERRGLCGDVCRDTDRKRGKERDRKACRLDSADMPSESVLPELQGLSERSERIDLLSERDVLMIYNIVRFASMAASTER